MHPGAAGTYGGDPGHESSGPRPTEREKVQAWRLHVLVEAGYPVYLAEQIAASTADLHRAVELVQAGCQYKTAAEILL